MSGPAGDEVVQVYTRLRTPRSATVRGGPRSVPVRELKSFQRVAVPAAGNGLSSAAAAAVDVSLSLSTQDLELVDNDGEKRVRAM